MPPQCLHFAAFLAQPGIAQYVRRHFLDTTFRGLYQANAFDLALLIPYFIVLILLASYGIHRYALVYLYYKKKHNTPKLPQEFPDLPRVTVQLPIFNEQYVIERLLDAICKLKYPREKLDIQVLDDSTDETVEVARGLVELARAIKATQQAGPDLMHPVACGRDVAVRAEARIAGWRLGRRCDIVAGATN